MDRTLLIRALGLYMPPGLSTRHPQTSTARLRLIRVFWVLAISAGGLTYRFRMLHHLYLTDPLFVGIPLLLAVGIAATPKAKTTTGNILKATTLGLLLASPLFDGGLISILMASPLIYAASIACCVAFRLGRTD